MQERAEGHLVDPKGRAQGRWLILIGIAGLVLGGVRVAVDWTSMWGAAAIVVGVVSLVPGIALYRAPTVNARIVVTDAEVRVQLSDRTVAIPWADVDHWGLVSRELALGSKQLILWPTASPGEQTVRDARRLWSPYRRGWALCFSDPGTELVEDFERAAPRPRHDGRRVRDTTAPAS